MTPLRSLRSPAVLTILTISACRQPPAAVGATATLGDLHLAQGVSTNSIGRVGATVLLRITNSGTAADSLVSAECDAAAQSTLHAVIGATGMTPLSSIPIPAGTTVKLHDGGPHIMIEQLIRTLDPGDSIHVTLRFAHAGSTTLTIPVLRLTDAYESAR